MLITIASKIFKKNSGSEVLRTAPPGEYALNYAEKLLGLVDDFDALLFEFGFFAGNAFGSDGV